MNSLWAAGGVAGLVAALLLANRHPALARLFHWLPIPLWCYTLPMAAVSLGWLPGGTESYRPLIGALLPIALSLLLLGTDLPSVARIGPSALAAATAGSLGIIGGTIGGVWLFHGVLPEQAWKGAGALSGTWTGGSMNLLALRSILDIPDAVFAPLIVTDAVIAYGWMALLMAASAVQGRLNQWLRADRNVARSAAAEAAPPSAGNASLAWCSVTALALTMTAQWIAPNLPPTPLVNSASGWTLLLVTTGALALSMIPRVRRWGSRGAGVGYPVLYLVLAAMGAQAGLQAFSSAPAWIAVGLIGVMLHGALLLLIGRWWRIPLGLLATASQANIGGVVSAPMVGAVYHRSLAPVGLVLAMVGNALGTYAGLWAAALCRGLIPGPGPS